MRDEYECYDALEWHQESVVYYISELEQQFLNTEEASVYRLVPLHDSQFAIRNHKNCIDCLEIRTLAGPTIPHSSAQWALEMYIEVGVELTLMPRHAAALRALKRPPIVLVATICFDGRFLYVGKREDILLQARGGETNCCFSVR
jgi:hypothetical protein